VIPGAIDEASIVERLRAGPTRCVVYNPRMYLQLPPFGELFPAVAEQVAGAYRSTVVIPGAGGVWQGLVLRDESAR
jgi:hypothetical protein